MPANYTYCTGCPYANQMHLSGTYISPLASPLSIDCGTNADILLVFQAPGLDEWLGNTISGMRIPIDSVNSHSAGNRMRKSMARKMVTRSNYDITEAVQCFPGRNSRGRDKKPSVESMRCCLRHLVNDLSQKQYKRIVAFGEIAYQMTVAAVLLVNSNNTIRLIQPTPSRVPHPSGSITNLKLDTSY